MGWIHRAFAYLYRIFERKKDCEAPEIAVILPIKNSPGRYVFYCPACMDNHVVNIDPINNLPCHTLTGSLSKPTVRASILSKGEKKNGKPHCHSFITKGHIKYLEDCSHHLAGKTVELKPI